MSAVPQVVGRTVPGWVLRVPIGVGGVGVAALLIPQGLPAVFVVAMVGLAGLAAALPGSPAVTVLIGGAALFATVPGVLDPDIDPVRPVVLALIPLCHALHVLAGIAALVPTEARVRPEILRRPAIRWVAVQAVVALLVGVVALLPSARNPAWIEVVALVAVVGLGGIVAVLARRLPRG